MPHRDYPHRPSRGFLVPLFVWVMGALVFFRAQVTSGFDRIMGDIGDARFIVVLHEHWLDVIRGKASWTSPEFYYPVKGVLGYSDTFLLNQLFYLPLRGGGLDKFVAFQWTLILMSGVGFGSFYVLATRHLHVVRPISLATGLLFAFANNLFIKAGHPQMFSVYWLPLVLVLVFESARAIDRPLWARCQLAGAGGLLLALVAYSSFYIGFSAALAALIVTVAIIFVAPRWLVETIRRHLRTTWPQAAAFAVGVAIGMGLFIPTYLPVLQESGGRTYAEVQLHSPHPRDVVNVSTKSLVWGDVIEARYRGPRPVDSGEFAIAITPLVAITLFVAAAGVLARRRTLISPAGPVVAALALAVAIQMLLPIQFDTWSPWQAVRLLPGATAIRAPQRIQIVNNLLAALGIAIGLNLLLQSIQLTRRRVAHAAAILVLCIVCFEQLNEGSSSHLRAAEQMAFLAAVPAIPSTCRTFAVVDSLGTGRSFYEYQIDAMLIADAKNVRTVNGYSSMSPPNWDLNNVADAGYRDRLRDWMDRNALRDVCTYDLATHRWSEPGAPAIR